MLLHIVHEPPNPAKSTLSLLTTPQGVRATMVARALGKWRLHALSAEVALHRQVSAYCRRFRVGVDLRSAHTTSMVASPFIDW